MDFDDSVLWLPTRRGGRCSVSVSLQDCLYCSHRNSNFSAFHWLVTRIVCCKAYLRHTAKLLYWPSGSEFSHHKLVSVSTDCSAKKNALFGLCNKDTAYVRLLVNTESLIRKVLFIFQWLPAVEVIYMRKQKIFGCWQMLLPLWTLPVN